MIISTLTITAAVLLIINVIIARIIPDRFIFWIGRTCIAFKVWDIHRALCCLVCITVCEWSERGVCVCVCVGGGGGGE